MRLTTILSVLVLLTLVTSCSQAPSSIDPTGKTPQAYTSPVELAEALQNRELGDGTMSFVAKYHAQGLTTTGGSGSLAIGLSETDTMVHFSTGTTGPGFDVISIGPAVYSRTLTGGTQPWKRYTIDQYAKGGPILVDLLFFARINSVKNDLTLAGMSPVAGTANITYRLQGTWQSAINSEMRAIGSSVVYPDTDTPTPLTLSLTLDPDDRLISASWVASAHGTSAGADYTFKDWGSPVTINAPVTG